MTTSAHAQSPRSLIVVPTLNEAAHVDDLLDLLASEAELVDGEIVVPEGGSVDETVAIAARRSDKGARWVNHGHHALIRTDAFRAVGGYDESFRFNEDAELDYRLTKSGRRIWLTAQTHMVYYPRATPLSLFRQYLGYGSGRARNVLKHGSVPKLRQVLPLAIAPSVGLSLRAILHWAAALPFLAWSALCLALGAMASTRRGQTSELPIGGTPLVGLAAMIM